MAEHQIKELDFLEQQFLLEYIDCGNFNQAGRNIGQDENWVKQILKRVAFQRELERLVQAEVARVLKSR